MKILFIGHSLIEFFNWQERFPAEKVVNLGVAGETARGLLARIDSIAETFSSADMIFLMTGLNDVAMEDTTFIDTYRDIVERLKTVYPNAIIYIHSILPTMVEFIDNELIEEVNRSIQRLAHDAGVEYIDVYHLFIDNNGRPIKEYFLDDGVHLSSNGYVAWSRMIEGKINTYKQKL